MTERTRSPDESSSRESSPVSVNLSDYSNVSSEQASAKSCGHSSMISGLEQSNDDLIDQTVARTSDAPEDCVNGKLYSAFAVRLQDTIF